MLYLQLQNFTLQSHLSLCQPEMSRWSQQWYSEEMPADGALCTVQLLPYTPRNYTYHPPGVTHMPHGLLWSILTPETSTSLRAWCYTTWQYLVFLTEENLALLKSHNTGLWYHKPGHCACPGQCWASNCADSTQPCREFLKIPHWKTPKITLYRSFKNFYYCLLRRLRPIWTPAHPSASVPNFNQNP